MTINDLLEQDITIQSGGGITVLYLDDNYDQKVVYETNRFDEWSVELDGAFANAEIKYIYPKHDGIVFEVVNFE